jgi:hypothetical protein
MAYIFEQSINKPYQVANNQGVYQPTLQETLAQKSFVNKNPYDIPVKTGAIAYDTVVGDKPKTFEPPAQPQDPNDYSSLLAGMDAFSKSLASFSAQGGATPKQPAEPEWFTWAKKYADELPTPPNPTDIYNQAQQGAGLDAKTQATIQAQQALDTTNAELARINAEAQVAQRTLESQASGKDVTTAFLGRQQQEVARQAVIRALPLQAQALAQQAVLTGNQNLLKAAQDKIDLNYKLQMDYAISKYNYDTNKNNRAYEFATEDQKAKLIQKQREDDRKFQLERDKASRDHDIYMEQIKPKGGGLTEYQQMQAFLNVSNKFQADSIMNQALKGQTAVAIADQVIANPNSATNQLKSLYSLVKNLDPDSAVREGELALSNQTQSYLDRFKTSLTKISQGQLISPNAAEQLAQATKELATAWNQTAERRKQQYISQANVAGIGSQFQSYIGGYGQIGEQFNPDDWEYIP